MGNAVVAINKGGEHVGGLKDLDWALTVIAANAEKTRKGRRLADGSGGGAASAGLSVAAAVPLCTRGNGGGPAALAAGMPCG